MFGKQIANPIMAIKFKKKKFVIGLRYKNLFQTAIYYYNSNGNAERYADVSILYDVKL